MSAQVYSYKRFSSIEQKQGSSLDRQTEYANEVAKKYNLKLNEELDMTDEALSAFHAEHVTRGLLGAFIKAVQDGAVVEGSILIVESLDRLSRQQPLQAQMQFNELLEKDITIITATDSQIYNKESLSRDPYKLFSSLSVMLRAHEESLTKQKRAISSIKSKIKNFRSHGERNIPGSVPFWIDKTEKGFVLNHHKPTVELIVKLYLKQNGLNSISRELASKNIPTPTGKQKNWGITTIRKVLDNKALYGVRVVSLKYLQGSKNIIETEELESYYPAVISEEDYVVIQQRKKKKANSREGYGKTTYLLSSYGKNKAICASCGYALGSQLQKQVNRKNEYTQSVLRLHCKKNKESLNCVASIRAGRLESAFLDSIHHHLDANFLKPRLSYSKIESLNAELEVLNDQISNLLDGLIYLKNQDTKNSLYKKIEGVEIKKEKLVNKIKENSLDKTSVEYSKKLRELAEKAKEISNYEERRVLKQILLQSLSRIIISLPNQSLTAQFFNGNELHLSLEPVTDKYTTIVTYGFQVNKHPGR
ncbi:recombinase family protein [Vibrio splendidus]|uniref:recombinase family protein n=1 Tax=Vibrio splendidus TaxID=29497 RepID=UPI00352C1A7C